MREVQERLIGLAGLVATLSAALIAALIMGPEAAAGERSEEEVTAEFEGGTVSTQDMWEEAVACVVWPDHTMECFRSIEQRKAAEEDRDLIQRSEETDGVESASSCPVRLYSMSMYSGTELSLHTRRTWHNLSNSGFSNRTSSYRITGCSATFRDGSWGSGATYPGATSSWTWSASMASGWNNRVSSVWIH